ncbi:hypothetical protein OG983_12065 [Streptomyces jietaisiensis]|uniref:hypothetical protein n=1 Tax=Streptomyces griseoaurantiacus TaxID=68213 RepID=UPI002E2FA9D4|nr:hypothetical protein [Streptomyces jietaisiensis]
MLLETMAGAFLRDGRWPVWHYVVTELDRRGLNAEKLLKSLPMVGSPGVGRHSYGLAWFDHIHIADESRPALTAAAGLHLIQLEDVFGSWFIRVVQYLMERQLEAPSSPDEVRRNFVVASEVATKFPTMSDKYLHALPEIMRHEPLLGRGYQGPGDLFGVETWRYELHRDILNLRGVSDLREYIDRVIEFTESNERDFEALLSTQYKSGESTGGVPPIVTPVSSPPLYVDATVRAELEAKKYAATFNLDKLMQLLTELDECYAANRPYSCHALLRAVIDHVPPILGSQTFEQVASNYKWTRTDKKYIQRLLDFKIQADDVLHRHISKRPDVITMHDVPPRAYLNALLAECVSRL